MSILSDLEPKRLWKHFDEIRKIPHPSRNEKQLADYVISVAKKHNLEYEEDNVHNVLIKKPATPGHENAKTVVLQSHLDMVCEKNSDKEFDFEKDEIEVVKEEGWLTANGTTLGSDNGIGIAAALAILEDDNLVHGPIEALFTVDEETGLNGAMNLSSDWLEGRTMINMDSEDLGIFSIGCAGGADTLISLPLHRKQAKGDALLKIHLAGLRGGHSGLDINEGRGNAVKILTRLLYQLDKDLPVEIVCMDGGDKHNAIPREAMAQIVCDDAKIDDIKNWFDKAMKDIRVEFQPVEKEITLKLQKLAEELPHVLDENSQNTLLALIFALPHGPLAMSRTIEGLVETSNNVASIKCSEKEAKLHLSSRSSNGAALKATRDKLTAIGTLAGADIEKPEGYPGWLPNLDSDILKVALDTYKETTGEEAKYEAIHAGLECGLIGDKYEGMDMISLGPTIKHPHSPEEKVHIGTVETFYKHVLNMLENLA